MFVARKEQFYHCVTEKLLTYALGRGLEPSDAVTTDRITAEVMADDGKFSTLLLSVVESAPFQTRRGDDGSLKIAPRVAIPEAPPPEKRKGRRFRRPQNAEFPAQTPHPTRKPCPKNPRKTNPSHDPYPEYYRCTVYPGLSLRSSATAAAACAFCPRQAYAEARST